MFNQNTIDRCTKGFIFPFPKKGDFGMAKNYRGIILTSIAAKIYNAQLLNPHQNLRENQDGIHRNRFTPS